MRSGTLRSRITIKALGSGQDAIGQPVITWSDVVTVWANIKHLSGSESIKADADVSIVKASIRIRKRDGITAAMRVYHGSVIYEIKGVLPDEENKERMDLVCEVVSG